MDPNILQIVLNSTTATLPTKATDAASGYDLYAAKKVIIPSHENVLISLDLSMRLPVNTIGNIVSRSGLATKHKIIVPTGLIDEDYTGNIFVSLYNLSDKEYTVEIGHRIAQLIIIEKHSTLIKQVDKLQPTTRTGGFGSTGY